MIETSRTPTSAFLLSLMRQGRYHFTTADLAAGLSCSPVAAQAVLRRLRALGTVATPMRGFHLVVAPEYQAQGCPPADHFVDALMEHVGEPYYAGVLSAAEFHGAAHHRPQEFQVVVPGPRPGFTCGRVRVVFVLRSNAAECPTERRNTPRGWLRIATPELTAFDVVGYPRHAGGLDNAATVLTELSEVLDPDRLVALAPLSPASWSQRLGWLLERVGAVRVAAPLARLVARTRPGVVPLDPRRPLRGAPRDPRWRLALNATVEPDL